MAEIEYLGPLEAGNSGAPDNGGVEYLGPLADDSSISGELIKGAKAGWLGANKAVGSVLEYTGELTGSDTIENIGKTTSDYWGGKLKKETPAVANMTDINSAGDFAKWAAWNVGQMGSQMAVTAPFMLMGGGGAVGTATGFQAIKSLVTRAPGAAGQFGRFLGQWAKLKPMDIPIGIMEGGQIAEGQLEELKSGKTKELSPIRGLAAAFVATKLEELGAEGALNRLMQGAGIKKGSLLRRIGQNALATGAGEGTEEFFQSYAEQVGIDPTDITSYDQFKNAVNGAAAGFVGGFFMGGGTGAVAKQTEQNDTPQNDLPIPDTKITRDDVSVDQAIQETAADVFTEETKSNMLGKLLKKTGEAGLDNNKVSSPNAAPTQYDDIIQTNADQYGVDPSLIKAVIQAESNFKNGRTSPAGAAGLMQLMPATAREMGVNDVMNPEQNIAGGVKYLAGLLQRYGGDEAAALAAYNWGPGNLSKYGIENAPKETRNYINKVLNGRSSFGVIKNNTEQNISSELDIPTYLRDLKQLPPGQGFTFKDVDYGIPIGEPYSQEESIPVRSKTTPIEGLPQPEERLQLPPGQGFDLVDKAEPDIVAPQKEKVAAVRKRLLDEKQLRSARKILPYYPARKLSDNDISILRAARAQGRLDSGETKVLASIEAENFSKIQKPPQATQTSPTNLPSQGEIVELGASSQEIAETRTGKGFAEGKTKEPFMPQTVPAKTEIKQATVRAKGAQNLVTKVLELGGLRVSGKDYVTRLLRQDSDAKRVLRMKDGLTADQLASRLQAEGWQIDSGDHLVELLKSGDARSIYAPEIVDDKLNRQAEREANEWAEQQVRELEAAKQRLVVEGIDTGRIEASSERIISDLQELAEAEEIETNTAEIGDFFDDIIASRKEQPQKEVVSQEEIPKGEFQNAELPGATAAETFTLSNPETEMSQHKPLSEQATVKNEEIPFNRKDTGKEMPSRGITTVRVQPIVDKVTSTLNINPKINVIQHVSECPKAVLKNMEERGILDENGDADVQGFAWNGETWLVADNLDTQKEVFQVLMHELTHNGLGALLKDQAGLKTVRWQYNKLMDKIIAAHRQDIMTIAQTTHTHLNIDTIEGQRQAAEEWLCNQSYQSQPKWYDKLVAIFHDIVRAIGLDVKLSDAEVRTVLQDAFKTFDRNVNIEARYARKGIRKSSKNEKESVVNYEPAPAEASKVQSAIEGKSVEDAINFIIDTAPDKAQRIIAGKVLSRIKAMQDSGISFELHIAHDRDRVPQELKGMRGFSYTEPGWKKVQIWLQGADVTGYVGTSYDTLLHESIHAVTQAVIESGRLGNKNTLLAYRELTSVSRAIAAHLKNRMNADDLNGLEKDILHIGEGKNNFLQSPDEILAYGLSSKKFQDYLETIPYKNETLWSRFVNSIRSALGLSPDMNTALSGVLRVGELFFDINQDWISPIKMDVINIKKGELLNESLANQNTTDSKEYKVNAFIRNWQDHMKAFDAVRDALRKTGKVMSDLTDVSRFETLARSKTANGIMRFMSHTVDPLVKDIAESHWTMEDVQDYAMMRHVPEANEYLAKLHNDQTVTANGITTDEAEAKLAGYEANPNFTELKDFADRLNQISDESLEILVKCGRISEDSRDAMKSAYQFYVPLRGGDVSEKTGKGMTVGGKIMRRKGHETRQEFILENIIKQRENAIRQANKNEAALSVTEFIMEADNPEIGTVGKPQKHAVFKHKTVYGVESKEGAMIAAFTSEADARRFIAQQKLTGHADVVETKEPSVVMQARPLLEDNEIAAYIDGYQIRVQLNHEGLARAATNTDVEQLNTILSVSKSFNRYLTSVYTQYNPEFAARNIVRDFSAGLVNLTGDYGLSIATKTIANYPKAIKELFKSRHDYLKSKYVKEYGEDGGQIGAAWLPSLEKVSSDLEKSYLEYLGVSKAFNHAYEKALNEGHSEQKAYLTAIRKVGIASVKKIPLIGHFLKLVDRVNMLSENAFRLSTYMTLRENGAGRAEAAEASKDVTINFDRHGELSNQAGALYLFFNPAVQGINRSFFALTQSKHKHQAQALTAMMIGAGYMLAGLCDKDEWDKINRGVKSRSLIVSIGGKQFVTIPLSYEYGVFTAIGYAIMDVLRGSRKPTEAALDIATATINALSPFGNPMDDRGNITAFQVLPTTAKIILAPTINQNTFGAPLMPQKYSESKPDSALMWRSTVGSQYDKISAFLNETTGGTRYTKGAIDISPETIKFFVNTLTGGTGTFISKLVNLSSVVGQGATPEKREIPFVSSFVRDITPQESRTRFWEKAEEVKAAATAFSQAKKKGDREAMLQIRQDFGPLLTLAKFANDTSKLAKVKRDAIESIRLDENISLEQKRAHMRKLELQEEAAYDTFLKVFEIRSIN